MRPTWIHNSIVLCLCLLASALLVSLDSCRHAKRSPYDATLAIPSLQEPLILEVELTKAVQDGGATLSVEGPFRLMTENGLPLREGTRLAPTSVKPAPEGLLWGDKPIPQRFVELHSEGDARIRVGDRTYRGTVRIVRHGSGISVRNLVDLEDYLKGVLAEEIPPWGRSPHALAAQAVVARTYALCRVRVRRAKGSSTPDMKDDTSDQVYGGARSETPETLDAVTATRGLVVVFNGSLVPTFYHSTCGGHTEPAYLVLPADSPPDVPPLMGRECPYCRAGKYYRWSATYTPKEVTAALFRDRHDPPEVRAMETLELGPGGHIVRLKVRTEVDSSSREMTGLAFRLALGASRLRSTRFVVRRTDAGEFLFEGGGWGHGAGMCQVGAIRMAEEGFTSLDILHFYYPGSQIVRIY